MITMQLLLYNSKPYKMMNSCIILIYYGVTLKNSILWLKAIVIVLHHSYSVVFYF